MADKIRDLPIEKQWEWINKYWGLLSRLDPAEKLMVIDYVE